MSFLSLPAEIRVKICKHLLPRTVPYSYWAGLRCCKTIRNEFDHEALKDMGRFYTAINDKDTSPWPLQTLIAPRSMAQIGKLRIHISKSGMLDSHHTNRKIRTPWRYSWVSTIIITYDGGYDGAQNNHIVQRYTETSRTAPSSHPGPWRTQATRTH
jgi:hypothetical protein